jgi:hypothetical protein
MKTVNDDYMRKVDNNVLFTKLHKNFQIAIKELGIAPKLTSRLNTEVLMFEKGEELNISP